MGGFAGASRLCPHSEQNLKPGELLWLHFGHATICLLPHWTQNFAPSGFSKSHCGHFIFAAPYWQKRNGIIFNVPINRKKNSNSSRSGVRDQGIGEQDKFSGGRVLPRQDLIITKYCDSTDLSKFFDGKSPNGILRPRLFHFKRLLKGGFGPRTSCQWYPYSRAFGKLHVESAISQPLQFRNIAWE